MQDGGGGYFSMNTEVSILTKNSSHELLSYSVICEFFFIRSSYLHICKVFVRYF